MTERLSEEEIRTLIAADAFKLFSWMHNLDVARTDLVRKTTWRMHELAMTLPEKSDATQTRK